MIYHLICFIIYINIVISLRCQRAWPSNCIYNSTCKYNISECQLTSSPSNNRGGMYCTTIIKQENDQIIIGTMDCIYDQETTKSCKNKSECFMKYTNEEKQFLHCCCDQHLCNLNFNLSNPDRDQNLNITTTPNDVPRVDTLIIIIISIITIIFLIIIIICIIKRNKIVECLKRCQTLIMKKSSSSLKFEKDNSEITPFISNDQFKIDSNNFKIEKLIKKGRFSEIYQGFYLNNKVSIKILILNHLNDESKNLFENEKYIYSLPFMDHFNILKYYGYSILNEKLMLINDYCENGSLKDYLRLNILKDENELNIIIKQISDGLQYLHRDFRTQTQINLRRPPIAHRDFKSENILFNINSSQIFICDFAMSTLIEQYQNGPNQQQQIGTPRYMSPELLAGNIGCEENSLLKCDVYALGIVFWEILSRFPFENSNVNKYIQPFEEQLNEYGLNVINPTVNDMNKIINLKEEKNRPLIKSNWLNSSFKSINNLISIMKECWEQNPESRISSGVVFNRIQQIQIFK